MNPQSGVNITPGENIAPEVREMEVDEAMMVKRTLEAKVKKMVQDEMTDMKRTITDLPNSMLYLTRIVQVGQWKTE